MSDYLKIVASLEKEPTAEQQSQLLAMYEKVATNLRAEAAKASDASLAKQLNDYANSILPAWQETFAAKSKSGPKVKTMDEAREVLVKTCDWPF